MTAEGITLDARFDRRLPMRLAALHRAVRIGDRVSISLSGERPPDAPSLGDLLVGAGFHPDPAACGTRAAAERVLSLADTVGPRMRLLVCGLNPSVYAAERGIAFARRSNRFWKAAVEAGLTDEPFDPEHAFVHHRIGMTDLCKRATVASAELTVEEYVAGLARVEALVRWLRPGVVAFIGLEGWRAAVDRRASPGLQAREISGRPAYVLPSTSGLNAGTSLATLVEHFRTVRELAAGPARREKTRIWRQL